MNISKKRLEELKNIPETDIDYSDIQELEEKFWNKAVLEIPPIKQAISMRIDDDVLDYFKSFGKGYQTRINSVLRNFYEQKRIKSKIKNKASFWATSDLESKTGIR